MESFEKTEAQKLAEIEKSKRRVQRISQVRQQANSWLFDNRQKLEAEKQRSLRALISEVATEVTNEAIQNLEELSRNHLSAIGEIGAAHRAAANYPNFQAIKDFKSIENEHKAKARYTQAVKKEKEDAIQRQEEATRLQKIRQSVRAEENFKSKSLVDRRPFRPRNVEHKRETLRDKLKREGYQQSLAKTLHVPGVSDIENQGPKSTGKKHARKTLGHKKRKSPTRPKTKHHHHDPKRVAALEIAANARAADADEHVTPPIRHGNKLSPHTSPRFGRRLRPKPRASPDHVLFVNANIPLPPQKYKAPPGLAVRVVQDPSAPTAWDQAKEQAEKQDKEDRKLAAKKALVQKKTKQRGKKALKIAQLEQRYNQLQTQLMTTIEEEDEEIPVIGPVPPLTTAPFAPNDFVARLNERYEEIMNAARDQMLSLTGEEMEVIRMPEWKFPSIPLPKDIELPLTLPSREPQITTTTTRPRPPPPLPSDLSARITTLKESVLDSASTIQTARPTLSRISDTKAPEGLRRKQEAMDAYLSVKEKLSELEEELQRRESQNLGVVESGAEQNQQQPGSRSGAIISQTTDWQIRIPPPTPPEGAALQISTTIGAKISPPATQASASLRPVETVQSNQTKLIQDSGKSGAPAGADQFSSHTVQSPMATGAKTVLPRAASHQNSSRVEVPVPNISPVVAKSSRGPRVSVKKSKNKIILQRKRSNLGSAAGVAVARKKSKEIEEMKEKPHIQKIVREPEPVKEFRKPEPKSNRVSGSTDASQKVLRHYIEKLLQMDPKALAHMSTSGTSTVSDSSNIRINSSAVSTSASEANSIISSYRPLGTQSTFDPHMSQAQNTSTPNFEKSSPQAVPDWSKSWGSHRSLGLKNIDKQGTPTNSSLSSSFPNVDVNIIYDSDTTAKSNNSLGLGSPIPRAGTAKLPSPPGDLRDLLANVCQRQVHCLANSTVAHDRQMVGTGVVAEEGAHPDSDSDQDVLDRFARLMDQSQEDFDDASSKSNASDDRRLRGGGVSTASRSPPFLAKNKNGTMEDVTELSNFPISSKRYRDQKIPKMIGQVADEWRRISIERPQWSE